MASETQSNEPETQLVEDEAPLELKDGLGTSLIPEQDVCVADKQEDQRSVSSLESQGQQAHNDLAQERLSRRAWRTSERNEIVQVRL